ncbi:MAG: peptidoglycan DD-metalloendopeptidase family protein [Cyclobacteriaceae bacterium]|nr:peptidoglycan DD-metalloendopeptidase family protein [Cyclobacteriaceae bacterium]
MKFNKALLALGLFLLSVPVLAQKTKEQLQKEKKENLEKIKEAQATLQKTAQQKKISLGQLNAYKFQINAQQNLIANYKSEITLLEEDIAQDQEIINSLKKDEENLKKEYAAMIYAAYKASRGQDILTFLFSSESFNQFFRRMHYMEQYSEARRKQVEQINAVREMLTLQIASIETKKKEQASLLDQQLTEKNKLEALKEKEQNAVSSLASREKELKKELEKRNKALASLNKLIDEIIKKELEAAAMAKAKAASTTKGLSTDFAKNKAHLPWPVKGFVSQHFGISKDPILKGVERNNPGVEIQTTPNTQVKCVSSGKVSRVVVIQGFNKAVIVNHGDYFSVYAKLNTVTVKTGQSLNAGDSIGTVQTGDDGIAELHFEIWKSFTKLDPELWLTKK